MSIYKIYKEGDDNFYIGSTKEFHKRKICHKAKCNIENTKLYNYINENGGWDNFKMEVLEYCLEYEEREKELIQTLKPSLNMRLYDFNRKEYIKNYNKKYNEKNKEEIKEKYKQYRQEYREENKDKINEWKKTEVVCECGAITSKSHIARHRKTKRHFKNLEKSI